MNEAQLYYDGGWGIRYYDAAGTEQFHPIEVSADASVEDLADAVRDESHWLADGTIKVCGGEGRPPKGTITIHGIEVQWRAS